MKTLFIRLCTLLVLFVPGLYADGEVSSNVNDLCYEPMTEDGMSFGPVDIMYTARMPIKNLNSNDLTEVEVAVGTSSAFSAFEECGVEDDEDGTSTCESASGKSFMAFSAFNDGVAYNLEDLSQNEGITPYTKALFSLLSDNDYDMVATYMKDGVLHQGKLKECPVSYCETHNLSEGFNVIDPDGDSEDNSFEIFCHEDSSHIWHDLLALPIKNDSNNFLFNSDETSSNYYDEDANPRTPFNAVEIDGGHITYPDDGTLPKIPLVTARSDEPWDITTDGKDYKVMGSKFSNINLIATPYSIDWESSTGLEGCDESKLRKALGQAVKYNTINEDGSGNDGKSRCEIDTMYFSLLDDYRFLVYNDDEVLQHSCKEMATYVPNNVGVLDDEDVAGHFNILTSEPAYPDSTPTTNGTRDNATDIGATRRPITTYCKYQEDLSYVWTFLTALDAEVTNSKNDITSGHDTCSQLGLSFFVPNTKETFNRVRLYLKNQKTGDQGWENYTGTIREKYKMYTDDPDKEYYIHNIGYEQIWPYGPLGIYYPTNGWQSGDQSWYGGSGDTRGWMSGSPMHNITTMENYNDSMGKKGFVSILGSQDLNKTDSWWVADFGAGEEVGNSVPQYSPHGDHLIQSEGYVYYEPNGNYTANAWLNFVHDSEGWVYHNDDNNAFYSYYDYMCMSETNYDTASRYTLIPGFFNAIERSTRTGNTSPEFSDTDITTKITASNIDLDVLLYKLNADGTADYSTLNGDEDKSAGVFLSTVDDPNPPVPAQYLGDVEDFSQHDGRISLPTFSVNSAQKRAVIQFYYCKAAGEDWQTCWDYTNNNGSITLSNIDNTGGKADSFDDFAIRPDKFSVTPPTANAVKAESVNLTYYAYDSADNAAVNYNEPTDNLDFNTAIADASKIPNCPNTTLDITPTGDFTDGVATHATILATVGVWNVKIQEKSGSEFALVDLDDTMDTQRYITPSDVNLTILPAYFDISIKTNINNGSNFTYLADDLDHMGINFDVNVTAKNSAGATTGNYSTGCYSNNINLDLLYSIVTPASFADKIIYKELKSGVSGMNTASDNALSLPKNAGDLLPESLFTTTTPGKAELSLRINFKRTVNNALNPFKVKFNDLNISDQNFAPVITSNDTSHVINKEATMVYGRTHAPRQRFSGNNGIELIYYETYCNGTDSSGTTCKKALLPNSTGSTATDDPRWFKNNNHNTLKDGYVGSISQKTGNDVTAGAVSSTTPATSTLTYNSAGSKGYPFKTTMENNASTWLIYNKYNAGATTNEAEVEFTDDGNSWAGQHETNTTTNFKASQKTNRRTMW